MCHIETIQYNEHVGGDMDLNKLLNTFELFSEIDPNMQISTVMVYCYVARRPGCTQKDIETAFEMTNAAASRNVSYWTSMKFYNTPGVGFLRREEDPTDRRYKILHLTDAGKRFLERLERANGTYSRT
jgi:DNA-binding MarR family transcriptional regulator